MNITKHEKKALIFGATGLVGRYLLHQLLHEPTYKNVIAFNRRDMELVHPKLTQHVIDFDNPESFAHLVKGDDLFCCLGTTRAKSGREGFIKVDYTYCFNAAKLGKINGVNQFLLVSSLGADKNSIFLYPQIKGKLEYHIRQLGYWAVHIFQPSFLEGAREEMRFGEQIGTKLTTLVDDLLGGRLAKFRPIHAEQVAKAMIKAAQGLQSGSFLYPSDEIRTMSEGAALSSPSKGRSNS